jgi:hypothetical protein
LNQRFNKSYQQRHEHYQLGNRTPFRHTSHSCLAPTRRLNNN